MKNQVAAEAVAAATLARRGWRPAAGALKLVFVSDEETGGDLGAHWLTTNHPEKVRCDMLINEGGGESFQFGGRRLYGVCCAEKGIFRFNVTAHGAAGHASLPRTGDNALLKLAPVLAALAQQPESFELTDGPEALLRGLGEDPQDPSAALARIEAEDPRLRTLLEPMFSVTLTPTMASASTKINVIPSRAQVRVDCRVPPGLGEEAVRRRIAQVLGEESDQLRIDFTEQVVGNASTVDSELMRAIERWIAEPRPGRRRGAGDPAGLLGFTLVSRCVPRVRRLRLLSPAPSITVRRDSAHAQRGRADRRARPRVRGRVLLRHSQRAARLIRRGYHRRSIDSSDRHQVSNRLDPAIFRLPVDRMREGYYSDAYFVRAEILLEAEGDHPRVTMQVFQKRGLSWAGSTRRSRSSRSARALGRRLDAGWDSSRCTRSRRRRDRAPGDGDDDRGRLLAVRPSGDALPGLARAPLAIMRNIAQVVDAARGKQIFYFPARHDHWLSRPATGSAHIAGAIGVSTDAQASWWGVAGIGTVPHGLIAAYGGDTVLRRRRVRRALPPGHEHHRPGRFRERLVRTRARGRRARSGTKLWGVRLDTSEQLVDRSLLDEMGSFHPTGVNPRLVENVRGGLDGAGSRT